MLSTWMRHVVSAVFRHVSDQLLSQPVFIFIVGATAATVTSYMVIRLTDTDKHNGAESFLRS